MQPTKADKEIINEALRWVRDNDGMTVKGQSYMSPRISSELIDCSMPLSFDSLSRCSLGCLYCQDVNQNVYGPNFRKGAERGKRKLKDIQIGDVVWGYDAEHDTVIEDEVVSVMRRTVDYYYKIELEDGKTISLSAEHPVFTKRGWVRADSLTEDDEVLIVHPYLSKIAGTRNLVAYNTSETGKATSRNNMLHNNPMKNPEIAEKMGATAHTQWVNGDRCHSPEHMAKIIEKAKARMSSHDNPVYHTDRSTIMSDFQSRGGVSAGERQMKDILDAHNIAYIQHLRYDGPEKSPYETDFFLPDINCNLEYDQHQRHFGDGAERDRKRDEYILATYGVRTIRIVCKGYTPSYDKMEKMMKEQGILGASHE